MIKKQKSGALRGPVSPPRQGRSRETLKRLVKAAEKLLDEHGFDDISIAQIAGLGNASVGAFYARFKDKDALLEHLAGEFANEIRMEEKSLRTNDRWREKSLEKIVGDTIARLVKAHRRHKGVLKAVILRAVAGSESAEMERAIELAGPLPVLVEEIKRRRGEINHPNPEVAVRLGLGMVSSMVRERVLFPGLDSRAGAGVPITDAVLIEELTRAVLEFLAVDTRPRNTGRVSNHET